MWVLEIFGFRVFRACVFFVKVFCGLGFLGGLHGDQDSHFVDDFAAEAGDDHDDDDDDCVLNSKLLNPERAPLSF